MAALGDLSVDEGHDSVPKAKGRGQQALVFSMEIADSHVLKEGGGVRPNDRVSGYEG